MKNRVQISTQSRARVLNTRALWVVIAAVVVSVSVLLSVLSVNSNAASIGDSARSLQDGRDPPSLTGQFSHAPDRNGGESLETLRPRSDSTFGNRDSRIGRRDSNKDTGSETTTSFVPFSTPESESASALAGPNANHAALAASSADRHTRRSPPASAPHADHAAPSAQIAGRVITTERGAIPSALVQFARPSAEGLLIADEARSTHSAADGSFSLATDFTRSPLLRATHPDYAPCFRPIDESGEIVIMRMAPPASLHVTILNADNTPATGAIVQWRLPYRQRPVSLTATTDDRGNATLALGIGDTGTITATSADGTATASASAIVSRADASLTLILAPTGSLRIRARNPDGDSISGASATVVAGGRESRQHTNADGIAEFSGIPQGGAATLSIRADGFVPLTIPVASPFGQIDLTLVASGPIVGTVRDAISNSAVADALVSVRFQTQGGESSYETKTAADGRFSLPLLGWHSAHTSASVAIRAGGYESQAVEVDFSRPREPLSVALQPHQYVRELRFVTNLGTPVLDGEITLRFAAAMAARPTRLALGVAAGARVSFASLGVWHVGLAHRDGIAHFEIAVDAAFCEQSEPHVLALPASTALTVTIREPLGEPSQQGFVALLDELRGHVMIEKRTDRTGSVVFASVVPGTYRLLCMNVDNTSRSELAITVGVEAMSLPVTLGLGR